MAGSRRRAVEARATRLRRVRTGIPFCWRAAVVQLVAVAALMAVLRLALPSSFFEDWGWISGPVAWVACAAITAMMLRLPMAPTVLGAVVCGIPSVPFVILGLHWLGTLVAILLFAVWCARLPVRGAALSP